MWRGARPFFFLAKNFPRPRLALTKGGPVDLSRIEATLDRIAETLEKLATAPRAAPGGSGRSEPTSVCTKLPDGRYQWEILPEHKRSKCKYCDGEVYWFKSTQSGKWCIVDPDGFGHRDRCTKAGNPGKAAPVASTEVPF
jgi:hypothetical protein